MYMCRCRSRVGAQLELSIRFTTCEQGRTHSVRNDLFPAPNIELAIVYARNNDLAQIFHCGSPCEVVESPGMCILA